MQTTVRRYIVVLSCVCWTTFSLSQIEKLSPTVVFLYKTAPEDDSKGKPVFKDGAQVFRIKYATGFFVEVDDDSSQFLVTAEHVSSDLGDFFKAIVWGEKDTPIAMSSEELSGSKAVAWVVHGVEDIAVARIHPSKDAIGKLNRHFMPLTMISADAEAPERERPLITLGFPLTLGTQGHFSPITRESKPASGLITLPRFDTHKPATFFLLSDPSISGFTARLSS